jgi:hypothetical protein
MLQFCNKFFLILILLFVPIQAMAGQAPGTCTSGSVHDMSTWQYVVNDPYQRVCIFCHTPHNANPTAGALWSRPLDSNPSGLAPYTWAAPANQQIPEIVDPLIGPSRLCMTCHDGTIALDAHGDVMPAGYVISNNLNFTHPIGFSFDQAMAARGSAELADKNQRFATSVTVSNTVGTYNNVVRNGNLRIVDVLLNGTYMTCSTCHDVHNCGNVTPDPGDNYNYLLWAKEEQSLICLTCHLK